MSVFFIFAFMGWFFFISALRFRPTTKSDSKWVVAGPKKDSPTEYIPPADVGRFFKNFFTVLLSILLFSLSLLIFDIKSHIMIQEEISLLEFLESPPLGGAAFGFLFGIFSGYWFSLVLYRQPTSEKASFTEIALGIVMAILLVLGIVGESTLIKAFGHLTTLEVPGAKFGFASTAKTDAPESGQALLTGVPSSREPTNRRASALLPLFQPLQFEIRNISTCLNSPTRRKTLQSTQGRFWGTQSLKA